MTIIGILVLTVSVVLSYPLVYGRTDIPTAAGVLIYGIRSVSLAWPIILLFTGVKHYEKSGAKKARHGGLT